MKKITKKISVMLVLVLAVSIMLPATAFAKTTYYLPATEKHYYQATNYDQASGELVKKLELSNEFKYTYDKKGNITKNVSINYNSYDKTSNTTWTKYSYKKGKITKATNNDGTYSKYAYKNGKLQTITFYTKKGKVTKKGTYTYNKKGKASKYTVKAGKKTLSVSTYYTNGLIKENVNYDDNGNISYKSKFDKYGNMTEWAYYSYDSNGKVEYSSEEKTENTYNKKHVIEKSVTTTVFKNPYGTNKSMSKSTYFTSGAKSGQHKETQYYSYDEASGKYTEEYTSVYNYKLDKAKNITLREEVDKADGTVLAKVVYTFKKFTK